MVRRAIEATLVTTLLGFATAKIAELDKDNQRLRAELARQEHHQSPVDRLRGAHGYAGGCPPWTVPREYRRET